MGRKSLLNFLEAYVKDKKFENVSFGRDTYLVLSNFVSGYGEFSCIAEEHKKSDDSIIQKHRIYPNLLDLVEYLPDEQTLPKCTNKSPKKIPPDIDCVWPS